MMQCYSSCACRCVTVVVHVALVVHVAVVVHVANCMLQCWSSYTGCSVAVVQVVAEVAQVIAEIAQVVAGVVQVAAGVAQVAAVCSSCTSCSTRYVLSCAMHEC